MKIDMQCTWWPDRVPDWFGGVLTPCCQAHDMGGTDIELWQCVALLAPGAFLTASIMLVGVMIGRPVYRWLRDRR